MKLDMSTRPTFWHHLYFWSKELMIFLALITTISFSFIAFFFFPEGYLSSELLTLLFY